MSNRPFRSVLFAASLVLLVTSGSRSTAEAAQAPSNLPASLELVPEDAAFYNAMLRLQTTTDMTADEIHALGLAEVARIRRWFMDELDGQVRGGRAAIPYPG